MANFMKEAVEKITDQLTHTGVEPEEIKSRFWEGIYTITQSQVSSTEIYTDASKFLAEFLDT